MSNFSRYLPFFIITLVVYGSFFYLKNDPKTVNQHALSKKHIVQLSTLKQNQKNSSTENIQHPALSKHSEAPIELNKTTKATNNRLTTKIKQAPATKNAHKSESNTNTTLNKSHQTARSAKKPLKITATSKNKINQPLDFTTSKAIDAATLKAFILDRMLYLDLDLPKRPLSRKKKRSTDPNVYKQSSIKIAASKAPRDSLSANVLNTPQKEKRLFKPTPQNAMPKISTKDNPQNLQEAISITRKMPKNPPQALNQHGLVVIKFLVTSKGETRNPSIMVSSGHSELDRTVISFVIRERFMPALKNGKKVSSEQIYSHIF